MVDFIFVIFVGLRRGFFIIFPPKAGFFVQN